MAGLYPPKNHNIKRFMEGVDPCHFIDEKVTSICIYIYICVCVLICVYICTIHVMCILYMCVCVMCVMCV